MHEWGYRYTWPPVIGDLTFNQYQTMLLAERAEAYVQWESQEQAKRGGSGGSVSDRHYDVPKSRREWAAKHKQAAN